MTGIQSGVGSPSMAGDIGEDDGMGLEQIDPLKAYLVPNADKGNEESSFVDSEEKRDKVDMTFDNSVGGSVQGTDKNSSMISG